MTPAATAKHSRSRFLGWSVAGGAAVLQLLGAALFGSAFGVYVVALSAALGWSKTVLSTAYALVQLESGILGPPQGWLIDRFGARRVAVVGVVAFSLGLLAFSAVTTVSGLYGAMVLIGVGVSFAGFLTVTSAIVPWFVRHRARALAVTGIGFGVGGLLVPFVAAAVEAFGWRETLVAAAVTMLVFGLPAALLLRPAPHRYGQLPDGASAGVPVVPAGTLARAPSDETRDLTLPEAFKTRSFWLLNVGHGAGLLVVSAVLVHLIPFLTEGRDFTLALAATMMALLTAFSTVGQVAAGILGDRYDYRTVSMLAMLAHAAGLVVLAWGPGLAAVLAFAVLHGFAWGMRMPLMSALRADFFGATHFGSIMGASIPFVMLGQLLGPIVAGTLADVLGDYRLGFTLLAAVAAAASLTFRLAVPPKRGVGSKLEP